MCFKWWPAMLHNLNMPKTTPPCLVLPAEISFFEPRILVSNVHTTNPMVLFDKVNKVFDIVLGYEPLYARARGWNNIIFR